jgi:putative transposase
MPRRARIVVPFVPHHVTQRGNNRQPVFTSSDDYRHYLHLFGRLAAGRGVRILAYCLMPNHVHLIAVPEKQSSLAEALGRVHSEYALALNRAKGRSGHVWQNRFFSCPLSESHLWSAVRYVELNPVRAGIAAAAWDWPWSSARGHTETSAVDEVRSCDWTAHLGPWDYREWKEILAAGMAECECAAVRRATATGEPLGPREFTADLERQAGRRLRGWERGRPRKPAESPEDPYCATVTWRGLSS